MHGCTGVAPQPRRACMIARTEAVSKEEMQLGRHLLLDLLKIYFGESAEKE